MNKIECPECEGSGQIAHDEYDVQECTLCDGYGVIITHTITEQEQLDGTLAKYVDEIRRVKVYIRQWQGLLSGKLMVDKNNNVVERREPQEGDYWFTKVYFENLKKDVYHFSDGFGMLESMYELLLPNFSRVEVIDTDDGFDVFIYYKGDR